MMREDRFTNTPEDAGRYEAMRGQADDPDDRPTLAEATRDEADDGWPEAVDAWDAHEMDEAQLRLDCEPQPCPQEMCRNWTGMGCACRVYGLDPDVVEVDR